MATHNRLILLQFNRDKVLSVLSIASKLLASGYWRFNPGRWLQAQTLCGPYLLHKNIISIEVSRNMNNTDHAGPRSSKVGFDYLESVM